jgi:SPP1 gp7 family putative phage head morphogenesis protein
MLARSETIRAYAESTLAEFRNWGVEGVTALAEFQTAHDDRVCPKCSHLEGVVYTLDEASGIIPVHPNCRCYWLPWIEELQKYK